MAENKTLSEIQPFIDACDKMCASKFIMIDKRVSDVLRSVASNSVVFACVKDCMLNFSFEREWKIATTRAGRLVPPEDNKKFIAFVFCLLSAFDNKQLSASDILSRYFTKGEDNQGPYSQFCTEFVEQFKLAVIAQVEGKGRGPVAVRAREKKEPQKAAFNKDVLSRLEFLVKDLKTYVAGLKKLKKSKITKGELAEIIGGLLVAIKNEQVEFVRPFVNAIKGSFGKDKEIERRLVEIIEISKAL